MRVCSVFYTSAGTNFVRPGDLPRADVHVSSRQNPTISDAIGRPLNIVGKTALYVLFGSYVVKFHFYISKRLATAYVLGG